MQPLKSLYRLGSTVLAALLVCGSGALAAEKQPVMGAGPSAAVAKLFFEHFARDPALQGHAWEVDERSIKHGGGIQASDKYLFGRSGRPLSEEEKAPGKKDLFLARIPLAFVAGAKAGVRKVSRQQLEDIYARRIASWKELGGVDHAIVLVGREPTEAAFVVLRQDYPFLKDARFDQVLERDHQVINMIKSSQGDYALAFGAAPNFEAQRILDVEGFDTHVNLGLIYDVKNENHPAVQAAIRLAQSAEWLDLLRGRDMLPPKLKK